jgi:hypothetical protein
MMDSRQGAGVDVELGGGLEQPCVGTVSRLTALSEHVPSGLKRPYRFVGARCTLPRPRPHADYTIRRQASAFGRKSRGLNWATGTGGCVVSGLEAVAKVAPLLIQPFPGARTSGGLQANVATGR